LKLFAPLIPIHKELSTSFLQGMLALDESLLLPLLGYMDSPNENDSGLIFWDLPFILKALPVEKTIIPFLTIGIMVALSHSIVTFTVPIILEPLCTSE
jgi:hypothetical protein